MQLFTRKNINVASTKVYYDTKTSTKINETFKPNLLQYESQMFHCNVQLEIRGGKVDSHWSIGLVQACDNMYLEYKYGNSGSAVWEFHPLKSGRHSVVNDGHHYAFYNSTNSIYEIQRCRLNSFNISLNYEDFFYPTVAWELSYCGGVRLTDVIRRQSFWIWLVAIQRGTDLKRNVCEFFDPRVDNIFILQTMRWHYNLHMNFNPDRPVGDRLQFIKDNQTELPFVLAQNRSIPLSALSPPNCEAAQSLIWYPNNLNYDPEIIVPPKQTIVPWEDWILDMSKDRKMQHSKPDDCTMIGKLSYDQEVGNT